MTAFPSLEGEGSVTSRHVEKAISFHSPIVELQRVLISISSYRYIDIFTFLDCFF